MKIIKTGDYTNCDNCGTYGGLLSCETIETQDGGNMNNTTKRELLCDDCLDEFRQDRENFTVFS